MNERKQGAYRVCKLDGYPCYFMMLTSSVSQSINISCIPTLLSKPFPIWINFHYGLLSMVCTGNYFLDVDQFNLNQNAVGGLILIYINLKNHPYLNNLDRKRLRYSGVDTPIIANCLNMYRCVFGLIIWLCELIK